MPRRAGQAAREANAAAQRRRRERLAQARREAEALRNAERHRERRAGLAEEELEAAREADRERVRERRHREEEEQRDARRAADAAAHRDRRAREDRASRAACDADAVLSGRQQVAVLDVGRREVECLHCRALLWRAERATLCCSGGKVQLEPVPPPPPRLRALWTDDDPTAQTFRKHARRLNTALSLASLMTREVQQPGGGFSPSVVIQGRLYHRIGPLRARDGEEPAFAQIYVNDPECDDPAAEAAQRLGHVPLPRSTREPERARLLALLEELQVLLRQVNPYVQDFIHAAELPEEEVQHQRLVVSADARPADQHPRRYNRAEGFREVSILMDEEPVHQDIVLRRRAGAEGPVLQTINETHRAFEALHFILLLPWGTDGWQPALRQAERNGRGDVRALTLLQFYAHRLQERPGVDDSLHRAGRLFQEFACMAFARVETQRLLFLACHQTAIRAELYQRLQDAVPADGALEERGDGDRLGRRIILPASFAGGPRYYQRRYQDAMAIVRVHGRPTFFITFTCNPGWPEIQQALIGGQDAQSRPDLVARVFQLKLKSLLQELTTHGIFGRTVAMLMVIEFQKRGLPHSHILIIVRPEDRPRTGEDVDAVISAELPDPTQSEQARRLHDIVVRSMVHRECGAANPTAACMEGGRCSKGFPKPYAAATEWRDDHPYPVYRRRAAADGGQETVRDGRTITNQWVVPFCPYLSLRYDAHVNVEVCCSVQSVKYLFRYIYKGPDRQMVRAADLVGADDEIAAYQDLRSIGASEACWRLFDTPLSQRQPNVVALQVHLPDHQLVFFEPGQERQAAEAARRTHLTAWCRQLLYPDFPSAYTWQAGQKVWRKRRQRQATEAIGRVVSLSPRHGDVFFLRVLLHHVAGAVSFEELRTVNGVICATYREACGLRGLLRDDQEWEVTMEDAAHTQLPCQLRRLFTVLLLFCTPADTLQLFRRHVEAMAEDFVFRHPGLPDDLRAPLVLVHLERQLQQAGKELHDFGLPEVTPEQRARAAELEQAAELRRLPRIIQEELDHDVGELQDRLAVQLPTLLPSQRAIFDRVLAAVDEHRPLAVFVDAAGGTGKTYVFNALLAAVRSRGMVALAVAYSGIAATLLEGGRTYHSRFKAPLLINETSTCAISAQSPLADLIRRTALIVWDEAPMAHRHHLEAFDRTLRDVTGSDEPFGGKVLVLGGDFRQILPVIRHGTRAQVAGACLRRSPLWRYFVVAPLRDNMRARLAAGADGEELQAFCNWLLELGEGRLPGPEDGFVQLPPQLVMDADVAAVIDWTFGGLEEHHADRQWMASRAILAPRNTRVDELNAAVTERFPGEAVHLLSADSLGAQDEGELDIPQEYLNTLSAPGFPPHRLVVKQGMPLVLLRNLAATDGLCNGTRLIAGRVVSPRLLEATIACGKHAGRRVFIPRLPLHPPEDAFPFHWERRQFPVRPAFALTINKAQGQTLGRVAVFLEEPPFSHGQLYVAASRVGRPDDLRFALPAGSQGATRNVVYGEVLGD
ncbi:uncharacterized protein LOC122391808 [Amphibalanus amphitrite]|uniref:uncharacterized protein LOC122391808 n=1 Tax=Amphibalanus amphitrite TaxID=1232801 RepID=UPI001C903E03|nr:uncharacterized protein LOC122391808 [Amphibalanus amphitrite]